MSEGRFSLKELFRSLRLLGDKATRTGLQEMAESRHRYLDLTAAFPRAYIDSGAVFRGWSTVNLTLGDRVRIAAGALVYIDRQDGQEGRITIGEGTYVGEYNNLRASAGTSITIGRKCLISQFCTLISANHGTAKARTMAEQPCASTKVGVTIGDDVWLGSGVVVLPGAVVSDGAVVGAQSLVTGVVSAYEIWAGSPARKIGERQ